MSHLLEVDGLTTTFKGDYGINTSVDHICFHVDKGETVCIVGESGCGKSVTSLSIMGLLARNGKVTDGEIRFDGKNLSDMSEKELDQIRGNRVTMIFQDPLTSLNPVFTVGSQIMESIRTHLGLSKKEAQERAQMLLEKVGMPDVKRTMKKFPHTLSGGMRQRAMFLKSSFTGASSISCPAYITSTRSAIRATRPISCVIRITAIPFSFCSSFNSFMICATDAS